MDTVLCSEKDADKIDEFLGCYLLVSRNENPRIRGGTYIGFTVDPNRRIRQHNAGKDAGGARRTSKRGPWDMIVMVHGFPNKISALRFEWAWQHPSRSRRLKSLGLKKRTKETQLEFRIRILGQMLQTCPWTRLSLTVRWLTQEHYTEFPVETAAHHCVAFGPIKTRVQAEISNSRMDSDDSCQLCFQTVTMTDAIYCLQDSCSARFHMVCLAEEFQRYDGSHLIPIRGRCPRCSTTISWSEAVRQRRNTVKYARIHATVLSTISSSQM